MSTNIVSTTWVQNQSFGDWRSAWTWVYPIEYLVTHKGYAIDLVDQNIKIENAFAKTSEQIDELIKRDWQYLELNKSEKKSMQDGLLGYIKADKKNKLRWTNCLAQISKAWGIQ